MLIGTHDVEFTWDVGPMIMSSQRRRMSNQEAFKGSVHKDCVSTFCFCKCRSSFKCGMCLMERKIECIHNPTCPLDERESQACDVALRNHTHHQTNPQAHMHTQPQIVLNNGMLERQYGCQILSYMCSWFKWRKRFACEISFAFPLTRRIFLDKPWQGFRVLNENKAKRHWHK